MTLFCTKLAVQPEWIDHNGHMNVAFYVLAFDLATSAVYDAWGIDKDYAQTAGCSVFTLGIDVDYLGELFLNDPIEISTQLLDWDAKRVHYYHRMVHGVTGVETAVNEILAMNVNLTTRRSAPFPKTVQQKLAAIYAEQQHLEKPANSMRRLAIRRKNNL